MCKPHWPHFYASVFWPLSLPSSLHSLLFVWGTVQAYKLCCITGATADQTAKLERLQLACLVLKPQAPQPLQTHLCVFFGFVRSHAGDAGTAASHLACPASLPFCPLPRPRAPCLCVCYFFPPIVPTPLVLSFFSTHARTHARTHTTTHTHTHRRTGR
jgi:hypothetical protein